LLRFAQLRGARVYSLFPRLSRLFQTNLPMSFSFNIGCHSDASGGSFAPLVVTDLPSSEIVLN